MTRIRARAIRRMGELFEETENAQGARTDLQLRGDAPTKLRPIQQTADEAGISRDRRIQSQRDARVPAEEYERQVESVPRPLYLRQGGRFFQGCNQYRPTSTCPYALNVERQSSERRPRPRTMPGAAHLSSSYISLRPSLGSAAARADRRTAAPRRCCDDKAKK
jgi:hypothetical protein